MMVAISDLSLHVLLLAESQDLLVLYIVQLQLGLRQPEGFASGQDVVS